MENTSIIAISTSYSTPVYILLPIITIYCGIFLNISNHYVLRPKIQSFLQKVSFSSSIGIQIVLDVLSNLSFITYAISAFILTPPADHPFRILQYYNSYWLTICLAIVVYMKVPHETAISNIVFCKNGIILLLCYVNILYHYIDGNKLITLPAILCGFYVLNLLLNSYEQKFIQTVLDLLNIKQPVKFKPKTKMISHLPSVEILAKDYPISRKQLDNHLQIRRKSSENKEHFDQNKNGRKLKTKIDTKLIAQQKLLQICTSVHLSMIKRQQQQKIALKEYVGFMNGTISDGKNLADNKSKMGLRHRKTYFNNRNKDKLALTKKSTKRLKGSSVTQKSQGKIKKENIKIESQNNKSFLQQKDFVEESQQRIASNLQSESVLFYLFPVKIFQSSKIISTLFGFLLNLGVGVLFNYCHNVMLTLSYGRFADFVLSGLFLPMIPSVSPIQFTNTMTLSSILKFGISGLFACISVAINSPNEFMQWQMTSYLQYTTIVQIVVLIIGIGIIIVGKRFYKMLILLFFIMFGMNSMICYFSLVSGNE